MHFLNKISSAPSVGIGETVTGRTLESTMLITITEQEYQELMKAKRKCLHYQNLAEQRQKEIIDLTMAFDSIYSQLKVYKKENEELLK